jgi:ferredoxin-thioredoxin reductase catalytic subunit
MKPKSLEDARLFASMVATKQGWVLNPDADFREIIVQGLCDNFNRYGYFFCPCRDSDGSREVDKDSICPCVWTKADLPEYGHCYCGLYLSRGFAAAGLPPASIPDRRYGS